MKWLKRIDLTLVYSVVITCISFFQVLANFKNANRTFTIMAFISFAIFYLLTLIYLYVVYVREPQKDNSGKWTKQRWIRIVGSIAGAYFVFSVLFPVFSKSEWVYYGLTGLLLLAFVLHAIVIRRPQKKIVGIDKCLDS